MWAVEGQLPPSESLLREGSAMVRAVAEDLLRIDGCRLTTLRDVRLDDDLAAGGDQILIGSAEQERDELVRQAAEADWTIIIAPEFMGLLEQRCRWAERTRYGTAERTNISRIALATGSADINRIALATGSHCDTATRNNVLPDSTLVALASDKHATAMALARANVPVPVSRLIECGSKLPIDFPYPAVAKPVDGAGSLGLQWVEDHHVTLGPTPLGHNGFPMTAGLLIWAAERPFPKN
jgi:predicted ATP-grasp superfamily ATP-dependent carboligase